MKDPFTLYEKEVMSALYKSLNYCEEYDLPTTDILYALSTIENKIEEEDTKENLIYVVPKKFLSLLIFL